MPPPPSGPGATPPFAAPPTEGRSLRLWLGLGAGALVAVLCCGGGGAALVGLVVSGTQAVNEQAQVVVGDYLRAVKDKEYDDAYRLLCDSDQQRESPSEFTDRLSAEPDIASYDVGEATVSTDISVPVTVTYSGGNQQAQRITLAQDRGTGQFEVCGVS
ncbi:hypothetical protein [Plantactinospora sp. GCM10030261]|uniref:Rv0361 family membrane protein n=1 Tax=Plantactinospora sp. GCM10030261 TaxID=3273420 RepID=UPI00360D340A